MSKSIHVGRQRGVALVVALVVLLMVSVLGLSSMRSSVFSTKVSLGVQSDVKTFEAAETAINATYMQLVALNDSELFARIDGVTARSCIRTNGGAVQGACGASDTLDQRGLLRAESYSYLAGYSALANTQVSTTGGGAIFVDYRIDIMGDSEMDFYNITNHHLQETLKRGIKVGSEIQ